MQCGPLMLYAEIAMLEIIEYEKIRIKCSLKKSYDVIFRSCENGLVDGFV